MIAVVIPARNEATRIAACLAAMSVAQARLDEPVRVIVVADRCQDATARLAAAAGAEVVYSYAGRVGTARRLGVRHVLDIRSGPTPTWLACTDADSRVPPDWLRLHAEHERAGTDLLMGSVCLDLADTPPVVRRRLNTPSLASGGREHVYGAHLGVRTTSYLAAGEFSDVAEHEDVALVEAVLRSGGRVISTARAPVLTSGRLDGRTPGGVAGFLRNLPASDRAVR